MYLFKSCLCLVVKTLHCVIKSCKFQIPTDAYLIGCMELWPEIYSLSLAGVLPDPVVKCLTFNPGFLGSSRTGSSEFFKGVSLGKTLQSPSLVLVKPRKDMNNVSCRCDMTKILLKAP